MTLAAIRQFCIILSAAISVLGLFFAAFYKELRFSLYKTAGILAGYLLFILLLSARKPFTNLPIAYDQYRHAPTSPSSPAERKPESITGCFMTFSDVRQT